MTRAALALTGVVVGLQVVFALHAGALWRDEANSVATASALPWTELWRQLEFESFPATWLMLLRAWMIAAGTSDVALRIAGALGGLALVAALWIAMWRLGRTVPLVSLALLAMNPEIVRWSGSVRAWGLGAALAVGAMVAVYEATVRPTRGRFVIACVVGILSVHAVYQNAVLLAAVILAASVLAVSIRGPKGALLPIGIGAIALASLLPYVSIILRRREWDGLNQTAVSIADIGARLIELVSAAGPVGLIVWLAVPIGLIFSGRQASPARDVRWYAITSLALGGSFTIALYLSFRYEPRPWYYLSLVTLAAVCAELVVSTARHELWISRVRMAVAGVLVVAGLAPSVKALAIPQSNVDAVAATLATGVAPGDVIVANPWYYAVSLTRYYRGSATLVTIPPLADVQVHRYDLLKDAMLTPSPLEPLLGKLKDVLTLGGRVWIVGPSVRLPDMPHGRLPLPPLSATGWQSGPYEWNWMCEVGTFLHNRVVTVTPVPVAHRGGPYEDARVIQLQGWR